jgi:PAS domain-containing protein
MGDTIDVLFVSARPRICAAVERELPAHGPLTVTTVRTPAAVIDALSERDVDCIAVEHTAGAGTDTHAAIDATEGTGDTDTLVTADTTGETDALQVLRLVRDTDPAVPVVVFEAADASSVASEAISLDVTEYVREGEAEDPLGALARVCRDVSASYRAEQDVAMLNDLARNVYERITDGFFALDRDWQFTYVNGTAEEILEVDADDVVGENLWDAFPGAVGTDFYTEYHRAMAAQEPVTFRERYPPLEKTFEVRAFPSEDGLSVHFRTVVDEDDVEHSDHLLELTNVLSSDLLDSIEVLRSDLEAAHAASDDAEEIEAALDAVDRMQSLVNYSIRLASERPTPGKPQTD